MSTAASKPVKHVLISGISVAGPAVAYWLHRYGIQTTMIERYDGLRPGGQSIDTHDLGEIVCQKMDIQKQIKLANTTEKGMYMIDQHGKTYASLDQDEEGSKISVTNPSEILRGDLASVIWDKVKDNTEVIWGDRITKLEQFPDSIRVSFMKAPTRDFDLVINAEGALSRTRGLVFDDKEVEMLDLGLYMAWYTMPNAKIPDSWGRWAVLPKRRQIMIRPDREGAANIALCHYDDKKQKTFSGLSTQERKDIVSKHFSDTPELVGLRILDGLQKSSDIYVQRTAQVRMKSWSKGRFVCIGDAAMCGTALSGAGTTLSFCSAYILAGELAASPDDLPKALAAYEKHMRPIASEAQDNPFPHNAKWVYPESERGVYILLQITRMIDFIAHSRVLIAGVTLLTKALTPVFGLFSSYMAAPTPKLPDYSHLENAQ